MPMVDFRRQNESHERNNRQPAGTLYCDAVTVIGKDWKSQSLSDLHLTEGKCGGLQLYILEKIPMQMVLSL